METNVAQLMIDKLSARIGSQASQIVYLETHLQVANARIKELEKQQIPIEGHVEEGE